MAEHGVVEFTVDDDGWVTARESETELARSGDSKGVALNRLAKALEQHERGGDAVDAYEDDILLEHTADGWVASARDRDITSVACPTRQAALDDLDQTVAFVDGTVELSSETKEVLADCDAEVESGDAIQFEEVE